jgi:hypothetical protein
MNALGDSIALSGDKTMNIRIGSTKYELLRPQNVIIGDGVYLGAIDRDAGELEIKSSIKPQAAKQTFWHEVMHGMMHEMGEEELCHDEQFIESLSRLLYAFHEDNKLEKIYEKLT